MPIPAAPAAIDAPPKCPAGRPLNAFAGLIAAEFTWPLANMMTSNTISVAISQSKTDAEDPRREFNVEVAENGDQQGCGERKPVPPDDNSVLGGLDLSEVREASEQRDLEHAVGDDHQEAARHSELTPESVADEAVEAARGRHLARHRDIGDAEDQQHDRREP